MTFNKIYDTTKYDDIKHSIKQVYVITIILTKCNTKDAICIYFVNSLIL